METVTLNCIVTFFVFVAILYRYLSQNFNYWKERNVKFPTPKLFIGNIAEFLLRQISLGEQLQKIYKEYPKEKFIGIFKMNKPELIVCDPDEIKRVLISDFKHFGTRNDATNPKREPLSMHLFNLEYEQWKPIRQKFSPTFTSAKLKSMFHLITEISEEYTKFLANTINDGKEVDCMNMTAKFTTDVIGSCGFGIKMNSMMEEETPFRIMGARIFEGYMSKFINSLIKLFSPTMFDFFKLRIHDIAVEKFFIKLGKEIMEQKKKSGVIRNDFIDFMMEVKRKNELEKASGEEVFEFDDNILMAQVFIFFAAGFETSATLMAFTLHELAFHPEIQEKVYQEINTVLEKNNGKLNYETVSEMHYLDIVVSETQRLYPALGVLTRICTIPYTFPNTKVSIEKGMHINIPVHAIHHDPMYYPDPEKFIPERFLPEAQANRHPMVFLPFGDGPRNCVGLRLGKMQSMTGLITILKDYVVSPCGKSEKSVLIHPATVVTSSKNRIWLNMQKRNK